MRNFAVLFAMIAGFTLLMGPAIGLSFFSPSEKPRVAATGVSVICLRTFTEAEGRGPADTTSDVLDPAVRSCASLKEWMTAAQAHPGVFGGEHPRRFLETRCHRAGLGRYAPCREVGRGSTDPAPGTVTVLTPAASERSPGETAVGVEIILPRIGIARDSVEIIVREALAQRMLVAIRTFGGVREGGVEACRTRLSLPLAPLDRTSALERVGELRAHKKNSSPIAASLSEVADDLAGVPGRRTVVLVSDGDETCGGDPRAEIERLRASWPDLDLHVVGIALDDADLKERMAGWAEAGGGGYFDAASTSELVAAIEEAITGRAAIGKRVRVVAPDGALVARGTVGDPIRVKPGTYQVEVLTAPPIVFEKVLVFGGDDMELELPEAA